ncbi:cytochrome b/b6 domain-containing protein, partial [Aeromonas caviae]|uniref:cytochrome b/b6 domain-containing protein n=2 Tax=Pseudomonadota TaxID=1224 RepID=UPI0038D167E2
MTARSLARPRRVTIHPLIVRLCHWINAAAMIVMILSGWAIHNADPIAPFLFPGRITLGGGLIGGLQWHFAAMWVLFVNGILYLVYGFASGRF